MRLTDEQRRLLRAMDDGPEEDSVGLPVARLSGHEFRTCDSLVKRGLAKLWIGRLGADWYRLTAEGRDELARIG